MYTNKSFENPEQSEVENIGNSFSNNLILHNDEQNSFEYVIESLISICNHNELQAEQCAYITHFKGKCDIKSGDYSGLRLLKNELTDRGLNVTID